MTPATRTALTPPQVALVEVGVDRAGQRIDNFLVTYLKGVPKSRIYRLIRRGEVRVNKHRVRPTYRLVEGDCVRVPPVRTAEATKASLPSERAQRSLESRILYEDKRLLVIDKPSGMAVHGGSGVSYGAIETLRRARPQARFLELVHRLDRETSGCLMIAKDRATLRALHEQLRHGEIDKIYLALVEGDWPSELHRVEAPLRKNLLRSGERLVRVRAEGKAAVTEFEVRRRFKDATLVAARLLTGRTHQIRVHAAHAEHPVAGDPKYGDPEFNQRLRGIGLSRLFLHASTIRLRHPSSGERIEVSAPLDEALSEVLRVLARERSDESVAARTGGALDA